MNRFTLIACGFIVIFIMFAGCVTRQVGTVNGTVSVEAVINSPLTVNYTLEVVSATNAGDVRLIKSGSGNLSIQEAIASWDTTAYPDGPYILKLAVTDSEGRTSTDNAYLDVRNHPVNNTQSSEECPKWSCDGLAFGHNNVSIAITRDQYKDNMNCTILCTCPEGTAATKVYSRGYLENYYDYLELKGKKYEYIPPPDWNWTPQVPGENAPGPQWVLVDSGEGYSYTSNWTENEAPLLWFNTYSFFVEVNFLTDGSVSGKDGYDGFTVTDYVCSPYSVPVPYFGGYSYIAKVSLGQNAAASGYDGYSASTQTFAQLRRGGNYTLKVYVKNDDLAECYQDVSAWIDYNQDYSFEPADTGNEINASEPNPEKIYLGGVVMAKGTHTFSKDFTVPRNASTGKTRLRVSLIPCDLISCVGDECLREPESHTSCTVADFGGEFEDYQVEIMSLAGCELEGDGPPCGEVTLAEVVAAIQEYQAGQITMHQIIQLIDAWAGT